MPKFQGVLLDFDGTFADTSPGVFACIQYALTAMNAPLLEEPTLRKFLGPPLVNSFMEHCGMTMEEAQKALTAYRELYSESQHRNLTLYPGMKELIAALHEAGVKVGIASAKPYHYIVKILEYLGMTEQFDAVSGATPDMVDPSKTGIVRHAMELLGTTPATTLMVGDRIFDVDGAHSLGIPCAGVLFGFGSKEELEGAGAEYLAPDCDAILKIVLD